jgi:hypothetical protein
MTRRSAVRSGNDADAARKKFGDLIIGLKWNPSKVHGFVHLPLKWPELKTYTTMAVQPVKTMKNGHP